MSERRYSDEEVAAIFERASETERNTLPAKVEADGMTLSGLQEIGREVGISPEAILRAARSLDLAGRPSSRSWLGFPIGVGHTVALDRPLSDADWEHLITDLRQTFDARGTVRQDGSLRQWTNGNLQALVEPTRSGQQLRLRTVNGNSRALMTVGMAAMGVAAATWIATVLGGTAGQASSTVGIGFMAVAGIGAFAVGALRLPGWARLRSSQMEAVAARLTAGDDQDQERRLP